MPWSDVPVLSGVSYVWIAQRDKTTGRYSGAIFIPAGENVACASCRVPHENSSRVFCYNPWAENKFAIICAECHAQVRPWCGQEAG